MSHVANHNVYIILMIKKLHRIVDVGDEFVSLLFYSTPPSCGGCTGCDCDVFDLRYFNRASFRHISPLRCERQWKHRGSFPIYDNNDVAKTEVVHKRGGEPISDMNSNILIEQSKWVSSYESVDPKNHRAWTLKLEPIFSGLF